MAEGRDPTGPISGGGSQLDWRRTRWSSGIYSGGRPEVNDLGGGEVVDLYKPWKTQLEEATTSKERAGQFK